MKVWITIFFLFCITMNTCFTAYNTRTQRDQLQAIEDALFEQLLYMGDEYIEELEDAI